MQKKSKNATKSIKLKSKKFPLRDKMLEDIGLIRKYLKKSDIYPRFLEMFDDIEKNKDCLDKDELDLFNKDKMRLKRICASNEPPNSKWLDDLPYDLVKSFSLVVDKLENWI